MHKCLPRDAIHSVVFAVVRCPSVHLFVTLMYRNGQTYYQTFSSPGGPIILVFQKGLWNSDGVTQIDVGYQKFAIFNQYFRNTDTEYRGISKYCTRYRIPNRHEKNTDENITYRYWLQIPILTQLYSVHQQTHLLGNNAKYYVNQSLDVCSQYKYLLVTTMLCTGLLKQKR